MSTYKLYYYNARGRAEYIRELFAAADVSFDDVRLSDEDWLQMKDDTPLGQIPVLEVDGVKIGGWIAIGRFLGKQFHLEAKKAVDNAILDMLCDVIVSAANADGIVQWPEVLKGRISCNKGEYFKKKTLPSLVLYIPLIEKYLIRNNNGLLVGDEVTWVDILAAEFFAKFINYGDKGCLDAYPHILSLINRVYSIPTLRQYTEQRPATLY